MFLFHRAFCRSVVPAALAAVAIPSLAHAQFKQEPQPTAAARLDTERTQRYQVGLKIQAVGGPCANIRGTLPVPIDWPEQQVTVVEEEISSHVRRVSYRVTAGTVKQMVVEVPRLNAGEVATALVTLEVRRRSILAPEETANLSIPQRPEASMRVYLAPSPQIESTNPRIRKLAQEILDEARDKSDWEKVEAIYDWVRDNIEYKHGPLKGALRGLIDGTGDCEEMTSLFIALCRANGIPARTVWVPGHCYPEFYLVDDEGQGHWFPCQAAGTRAFGSMPEHRPILQKGDNFRDSDRPRERMRYMSEFLTGSSLRGGGQPVVEFIRREIAAPDAATSDDADLPPLMPQAPGTGVADSENDEPPPSPPPLFPPATRDDTADDDEGPLVLP